MKKVSRLSFARLFPAYSAGRAASMPGIARVVTPRTVRIQSEEDIVTCLDGECFRSRDVTLRLAEGKVRFFAPAGCDPNATAAETAAMCNL